MSASEIVIGIDFGTTYSGVSWAVNGGAKVINHITNWPNPRAQNPNSDKVPSIISYQGQSPSNWGFESSATKSSFKWIKILLEPDSKYAKVVEPVKASNELLQRLQKDPVDVVTDYLRLLWNYIMEEIRRKQGPNFTTVYALKVVVTVPAVWSPTAKDRTLRAAKSAGMSEDISLVSEPEAAALATLNDKEDRNELKAGDCFVVCDAGGGTVDLISYQVESVRPLRIKECAVGEGGLCGSVFIDLGFKRWLEGQTGEPAFKNMKETAKRKLEDNFEYQVKRGFNPAKHQHYSLEIKGVADNAAVGIDDGEITVKAPVIRTVFDHICGQIEGLIYKQIAQVERTGKKVKAVLLVGGFGESGCLFDRLEKTFSGQSISLLQVTGAWSAICRGATMWGLQHSSRIIVPAPQRTVTSRLARFSLGFILAMPYNSSQHLQCDKMWDTEESIWRAKELRWVVRKGDEIKEDAFYQANVYETVQVSFFDSGYRNFVTNLYYSEDDEPSTSPTTCNFKKLCGVEYSIECDKIWAKESSFRNRLTKVKYRNVSFSLIVHMDGAELQFLVTYRDELAAACEAKYPETV